MNVLINEIEIKGIYIYDTNPMTPLAHAFNLRYELGETTSNNNRFDRELQRLIRAGVIEKVYDFTDEGYREGLYNFVGYREPAQLSFHGVDHMGLRLYFNYEED